ncbi:uncharacterized protein [Typha angustifolia]|uniref:uncharacterized protein isoform X2 n=1 Tax=Typha angustifolia TaxID=59011 RepID=UPI003C2FB14A
MDNLYKQLRVRFANVGEEDKEDYNKRTSSKKTVSFKEENKKGWNTRQFSGQLSDSEVGDGVRESAIAAAAYAITLQEEERLMKQKKALEETEGPLTDIRSTRGESMNKPIDQTKFGRMFSSKGPREDKKSPGEGSMKKSSTFDGKRYAGAESKSTEKATDSSFISRKSPTFSSKSRNDRGSKKFELEQEKTSQQAKASPKLTSAPSANGIGSTKPTDYNIVETGADAWEKDKMAKIERRYNKMNSTIRDWEGEKKVKAKRRLERKERELERRRTRAMQEYRNEMTRVDKVVEGAKASAEDRKRYDQSRIIDKANKMRSQGKAPKSCSCF